MSAETLADLIAALRDAATPSEPEFMTVPEYAAYLRVPERWIRDRLMPSHPEFLQHHRFTRNNPVFSRADRAANNAHYLKVAPDSASEPSAGDGQVLEFDPKAIRAGARTLGITA